MTNQGIKEALGFSIKEFFETVPPGQSKLVVDLIRIVEGHVAMNNPDLLLHCETPEICDGLRQYRCVEKHLVGRGKTEKLFVTYICKNCSRSKKIFSLLFVVPETSGDMQGEIYKFGEIPNFGPPTPARLTRLLGVDKDLFLKGRRAENQGMGIAAFAYYRRVIESQKDAIFEEIIRVSKGISADLNIIAGLELAKKQVQFTGAVEAVKDGIPPVLLINGHNPLTLLHSALSEGLHAKSDADCLAYATDMRIVMAEFVERMAQAMKDNAELHSAVSRLLSKKSAKPAVATPQIPTLIE